MSRTEPATLRRVAVVEAHRLRLDGPSGSGRPDTDERILTRLTDETGACGWGEIPAVDQDPEEIWNTLVTRHAPRLLAHTWHRPTEVREAWADLRPVPPVEAGLDMACWVLWSQRRATPLAHALGGTRTTVTAGGDLGLQVDPELAVRAANRQVGRGIRRVRLGVAPGAEIETVRALRETYPSLALQVDGQGRYTEDPDHLAALRGLDSYGLLAIEQPFPADDLPAHARLQQDLRTPLALGAGLDSLQVLDQAIAMHAAGALHLRPTRLGGLTVARRAHDRAADAGWQIWCGADAMVGPGLIAATALASLPGVSLPSDLPGTAPRRDATLVDPPVRAQHGVIAVPLAEPGLGHTVNEPLLDARTVASVTLRA